MLLTHEDMKYLKQDFKNGGFHFTGKDTATKEEKEKLKKYEKFSFENYGEHLINNYEDLD